MIDRDEDGKFLPGKSPNPGGRPKEYKSFRDAVKHYLAETCIENVKAIEHIAKNADNEKVQLSARIWLAEQFIGKAVQQISDPEGNGLPVVDLLPLLERLAKKE